MYDKTLLHRPRPIPLTCHSAGGVSTTAQAQNASGLGFRAEVLGFSESQIMLLLFSPKARLLLGLASMENLCSTTIRKRT